MTALVAILLAIVVLALAKASHAASHTIPEKLAKEARYVAAHGGVLGSCHDCATPRMKELVRRLIVARFAPEGPQAVRTATCLAVAESGLNPHAISRTGDYGTGQINYAAHHHSHPEWWQPHNGFRYALFDPVYGIGVMWAMSSRGTDWSAWTGTWGRGMCR